LTGQSSPTLFKFKKAADDVSVAFFLNEFKHNHFGSVYSDLDIEGYLFRTIFAGKLT